MLSMIVWYEYVIYIHHIGTNSIWLLIDVQDIALSSQCRLPRPSVSTAAHDHDAAEYERFSVLLQRKTRKYMRARVMLPADIRIWSRAASRISGSCIPDTAIDVIRTRRLREAKTVARSPDANLEILPATYCYTSIGVDRALENNCSFLVC